MKKENRARMPGFTAEFSRYAKSERCQIAKTREVVSDGNTVIPQRRIAVKCVIDSNNELHCGYYDYDRRMSVSLF